MVDRRVLDQRGVFTSDMEEVADRFSELHGTLTLLASHAHANDDHEMMFALQGVARTVLDLARDVDELDEVLRDRGAIVDAEEAMARQREPAENVVPLPRKRVRKAASK